MGRKPAWKIKSSYAKKVKLAQRIRKIQSIPVKKITKAQAQRMNKLVTAYIKVSKHGETFSKNSGSR